MSLIKKMSPFETWWYHDGSVPPLPDEDVEEFAKRICQIAWEKSAQVEREACANVCEEGIANADDWNSAHWDQACENRAWAIRARGQA